MSPWWSSYTGLKKACCPDGRKIYLTGRTGESCRQRCPGVYAEIVVMLSENIPFVPPTPPQLPSPLWSTSNSWLLHEQHANGSWDVMPPHPRLLRSGGDSPLSCGSTFNFHPTWRCTSYYLVQGVIKNATRTHPFLLQQHWKKKLFRLACQTPPTCHHHGYGYMFAS